MKIALIANSGSSQIRGYDINPDLENIFKNNHILFDLFTTRYHGHAFDLIRQLSIAEYDAVISMGGDGTNYQAV